VGAAGTITAYALIGSLLGFLVALALDARTPPRPPVRLLQGGTSPPGHGSMTPATLKSI
jgi:hypothetical protein